MRGRQRGIVVLLYMVGLLAVLGMAGFALDLGLALLTKTRLQNALDAAALDAAKTLYLTSGSTTDATGAANETFHLNMDTGVDPEVAFSLTQSPFVAATGVLDARFVRVSVPSWPVETYLSRVLGLADSYALTGEAMAGPQPLGGPLCGAPLGVCAVVPGSPDTDCSDGNGCFGLGTTELTLHGDSIAPGFYGLLDMGSGAADVAEGMAGSEGLCLTIGQSQDVKPGMSNTIINATNSRFGMAKGKFNDPDTYPPDVIVSDKVWLTYEAALNAGPPYEVPGGTAKRRTMLMPVIDCSQPMAGASKPVTVLGRACMFLTRPVESGGSGAGTVYAQIIDECQAEGGIPDPNSGSGAVRIVLYQSGTQS